MSEPSPMPSEERRRLRTLALEALGAAWHNAPFLGAFIDGDDEQVFSDTDARFIEAASPQAVLALIDAALPPDTRDPVSEPVEALEAELRAAPPSVALVTHQDMYDALGEDADDTLYEMADRMYLFLTRRRPSVNDRSAAPPPDTREEGLPPEYDNALFTTNDSKALENVITVLGHFDRERDGSPCFCPRLDSIGANGFAVDERSHQPRCRAARIHLGVARGLPPRSTPRPGLDEYPEPAAVAAAMKAETERHKAAVDAIVAADERRFQRNRAAARQAGSEEGR